MPRISAILLLSFAAAAARAADHQVEQKGMAFTVTALKIKVGDNVDFKNSDTVNHNIFSVSDTKSFDLGSYPQGQSRRVSFDKPGTVEVECAIHPGMKMTITVEK